MNMYKWMFLIPCVLLCFADRGMEQNTDLTPTVQTNDVRPFDSVPREIICIIIVMAIEDDNWQKSIKTLSALVKTDKRFNALIVNSEALTKEAVKIIQQSIESQPGYYYFRH